MNPDRYQCILVDRQDGYVTITMNLPDQRNALSLQHLRELADAFAAVGRTDALGVILAGRGPVFSAGHDFRDLAGADITAVRSLLQACAQVMQTMHTIPQPVVARVHGLATAAGCQLVASADLAVADTTAEFAAPGGRGGWFCTTPMVAIGRTVARKQALELALTGDRIDAETAADWGLVNSVVAPSELEAATLGLLRRATRGSATSKGIGKQAFYVQIEMDQARAYDYATEVMANASQISDAQEGVSAFLEKRPPKFGNT
jgi:enoyl-CoA hydratase/carnithine racemase